MKNMGSNYGIIMLGFGFGAIISSNIARYFKNLTNVAETIDGITKVVAVDLTKMQPAFIIASGAAVIGAILIALLKKPKHISE